MGAVARRARRRASGTLTLTRPGSSPGGWSSALADSLPVSRQAAGCPAPTAGGSPSGSAGRAADGQQCLGAHGQDGVAMEGVPQPDLALVQAGLALCVGEAFFHRPFLACDRDQDGQDTVRPSGAWQ